MTISMSVSCRTLCGYRGGSASGVSAVRTKIAVGLAERDSKQRIDVGQTIEKPPYPLNGGGGMTQCVAECNRRNSAPPSNPRISGAAKLAESDRRPLSLRGACRTDARCGDATPSD